MAWVVRYWDEINKRNITSREISTREDAMDEACSLMQRHTVSPWLARMVNASI